MKVFIHIGIEKTGSSHLQSICAINRDKLVQNGIWFPKHETKDDMMLQGNISPGNAQNITEALNNGNFEKCNKIIEEHVLEAEQKKCHTLLLSNELLLLALAKNNRLNVFSKLQSEKKRFIQYLLFVRDPIEQALSLYKHRAKSGKIKDIKKWILEDYKYGDALGVFLKNSKNNYDVIVKKYSKKAGYLEKVLFNQCLNIKIKITKPPNIVNPSLTLSEIVLLKKLYVREPKLVPDFYNRFIKIDKSKKATNPSLEDYYCQISGEHLELYKKTWEICNEFLHENDKILIRNNNNSKALNPERLTAFSDQQLEEISILMRDTLTIKFLLKIKMRKLKNRIVALLRKLNIVNNKSYLKIKLLLR